MKILVTGAAGFVGSNFVDKMVEIGHEVIGVDNFSTGKLEYIRDALLYKNFSIHNIDLLTESHKLSTLLQGCYAVAHFAANADVRNGFQNPTKDLQQNTIVTSNVLEAMRKANVKDIIFSSTGSIYGNAETPTEEFELFPIQTSLYAASKLACEGLIQAYCEGYNMQSWIFRFVSLLGSRYSHGHIIDFTRSLLANPYELSVLGNGYQNKSYLNIGDCVNGMLDCWENSSFNPVNIFNLGTDATITIRESLATICEELHVNPRVYYSSEPEGWKGDVRKILLDTNRAKQCGWKPQHTIDESIRETVRWILNNRWILHE